MGGFVLCLCVLALSVLRARRVGACTDARMVVGHPTTVQWIGVAWPIKRGSVTKPRLGVTERLRAIKILMWRRVRCDDDQTSQIGTKCATG